MTAAKKAPSPDLIDQLLAGYQKPEDLIDEHGLLKQLTKVVVERALQAEMAAHLRHDKHEPVANAVGNTRNGNRRTEPGSPGKPSSQVTPYT
jgi:transposase-like protein